MAFIPVPDCFKLVPEFFSGGKQIGVNVLHFHSLVDITIESLISAGTLFIDQWAEVAAPYVANTVLLGRVTVTQLDSAEGIQVVVLPEDPTPGTNTSAALPNNVTLATAFKSNYAGKSQRGRAYWVGLSENLVTGDAVLATPAEAIRSYWQNMGAVMLSNDWQHVIVSYVHDGVPRTTGQTTDVTTYVNTDTDVDTQRRRLLKS